MLKKVLHWRPVAQLLLCLSAAWAHAQNPLPSAAPTQRSLTTQAQSPGATEQVAVVAPSTRHWATAPRHSAGIAPDPAQHLGTAIVQVYAAPTYGWRGFFAVHPWIIYKRKGESEYTRYDVVGWRAPQVVQRNYAVPDGLWYGSQPTLLVDHRGGSTEGMIDDIEAAIASYPFADHYRSYPGPNSNTFLAHIGRRVPALQLDLPSNAIGKDYRALSDPAGVSPSGSGLQISLLGLLGVSIGLQEGLEFNLLGLNFGIDLNAPALRLPFWGRLGLADDSGSRSSEPAMQVTQATQTPATAPPETP